jgi:hypothetical protein
MFALVTEQCGGGLLWRARSLQHAKNTQRPPGAHVEQSRTQIAQLRFFFLSEAVDVPAWAVHTGNSGMVRRDTVTVDVGGTGSHRDGRFSKPGTKLRCDGWQVGRMRRL